MSSDSSVELLDSVIQKDMLLVVNEIFYDLKCVGRIITEFDYNSYLKIDIDDFYKVFKKYGVEL